MNSSVWAVPLLAVVLLVCGCSDQASRVAAHAPSPSLAPVVGASPARSAVDALPSPPAPGPPAPARLTIEGSAHAAISVTQSQGACGKSAEGYGAQLSFPLQGQPYVLSLQIIDYRGPGQYTMPPERVSMHTESNSTSPRLIAAKSGTLVINSDERSGSIDASFSDGSRVAGTWACSAPQ